MVFRFVLFLACCLVAARGAWACPKDCACCSTTIAGGCNNFTNVWCPPSAYDGHLIVDCSNRTLQVSPNDIPKNTTVLLLGENWLTEFDTTSYNFTNLRCLDVSINRLHHLNVTTSSTSLVELIAVNNDLTSLEGTDFPQLVLLDLGSNNIESFDASSLNMPLLIALDLTKNNIKSANLSSLDGLMTLYLNDNQMPDVKDIKLSKSISTLHLNGNNLRNISSASFLLPDLAYLMLANNGLQMSDIDLSKGFEKLETLDLSSNKLEKFNFTQVKLPELRELFLSNNSIPQLILPEGVPELQILSLDGNQIRSADLTMYERLSLSSLNEIDLSRNNMNYFKFADIGQKLKLKLNENELVTVNYDISTTPTSASNISMAGNPLRCDCAFFFPWQQPTSKPVIIGTCHSPPSLEGKTLTSVRDDFNNCSIPIPTQTSTTSAVKISTSNNTKATTMSNVSTGSSKISSSNRPTESTESTRSAMPTEPTEPTEPTVSTRSTKPTEDHKPTHPTPTTGNTANGASWKTKFNITLAVFVVFIVIVLVLVAIFIWKRKMTTEVGEYNSFANPFGSIQMAQS